MQTFDEIVEVRGHQPTPVTLAVRDLSYSVRAKHEENGVVKRRKAILENVCLLANPGEMVAILSPAGAGKTTLLNILSKRLTSRHIVGRVVYNGQNLGADAVQALSNYVMSSDQLYPYLTVEETLSFAAELRLPKAHGSERREVVEGLMRDLELEECRSTIIGDQWQKGCSTGQIRRVSIAVELLGNPSLLLLDEPTTGLDSSLAYDMIRILRRLTQQGRTILCALHMPSSQVMQLFDQLILASRGRVVFQGPPSTSVAYFARIGYRCPDGYNPADFFMELVSSANQDVEPLDMGRELNKKGKTPLSVFSLSKEEVEVACNVFWSSPEGERLLEQIDLQITSEPDGEPDLKPRQVGLWRNLSALYRRTLKNNLRSPLAVVGILVCQLIQGVFFGSLFFQLDRDVRGIDPSSSIIHKDYAQVFTYGIDFKGVRPWHRVTSDGVGPHHGRPVSQVLDVLTPTKIATVASCIRSEAGLHLGEDHWVKEPVYPEAELPERLKLTLADISSTGRHVIYQRAKTSPAVFAARFHQLERDLSTFVEAVAFIQAHHRPAIQGSIDCMDHTWRYCSDQAGRYGNTVLCDQPHWEQEPMMIRTREVGEALHMLFRCALTETNQFTTPVMRCLELLPLPTLCDMSEAIPSGMWKLTNAMYGPLSSWTPGVCSAPPTTTTTSTARQWIPPDRADAKESFLTRTFHDTTSSMMAILNITAALFMGVANIAFGTYDVLLTFPKERVIFNRETANGLYHPWTFYLAKNVGDLPFQLVPNLAMAVLFYWMVGLAPSASQFAMWLLIASLVSLGVYSFGYFVSAAAPRMEVAVVVAPFSLIVMAMMSGFFLRDENMPAWICWVRLFSVFRYGFNAAVINQFSAGDFYGVLPSKLALLVAGSKASLAFNLWMLVGLVVIFRLLAFLMLQYTNRRIGLQAEDNRQRVKRDEARHAEKVAAEARTEQDQQLNSRVAGLYHRMGDVDASRRRGWTAPSTKVDMEDRETREQKAEKRALKKARRQWEDRNEPTSRHLNLFADEEQSYVESNVLHTKYLEDLGHGAHTTSEFATVSSGCPWYLQPRPVEVAEPEPGVAPATYVPPVVERAISKKASKKERREARKERDAAKREKIMQLRRDRLEREKNFRR